MEESHIKLENQNEAKRNAFLALQVRSMGVGKRRARGAPQYFINEQKGPLSAVFSLPFQPLDEPLTLILGRSTIVPRLVPTIQLAALKDSGNKKLI
jgi:hypothetical protein